jgi:hypothetical protein
MLTIFALLFKYNSFFFFLADVNILNIHWSLSAENPVMFPENLVN